MPRKGPKTEISWLEQPFYSEETGNALEAVRDVGPRELRVSQGRPVGDAQSGTPSLFSDRLLICINLQEIDPKGFFLGSIVDEIIRHNVLTLFA